MTVERFIPGPSDDEIRLNIERVLDHLTDINPKEVNVIVDTGWVTLMGSLTSFYTKIRSEDMVSLVPGAVGVTNRLSVAPTEDILDETIGDEITAAMDRNANVDVNSIHVEVDKGRVVLSGEVPSWNASRAAYESALNTTGVNNVENNLIVRSFV